MIWETVFLAIVWIGFFAATYASVEAGNMAWTTAMLSSFVASLLGFVTWAHGAIWAFRRMGYGE